MSVELWLESFDGEKLARPMPSPDYERGYENGYAAGQSEALSDAERLQDQLVQAVADINFTYAEARSQLVQSLQPLFHTIIERVLPHCVENGFAGQLADQLSSMSSRSGSMMCLHVHPDRLMSVTAALGSVSEAVEVAGDPDLTPYAAWIEHGGHETLMDVDGLLAGISETLGAINAYQEDDEQHG